MLKSLIKQHFDMWVRTRWVKTIHREYLKMDKFKRKYDMKRYVVKTLADEFIKRYGDTPLKGE